MASYDIGRLVWKVEGDTSGVDQSLKKTESGFGKLGGAIKGFMALGIVGTFYSLGKAVLSASATMEKSKVAFTTMLGSAEKANALLKEMTSFAANTPFELPEIVNAGKQLLAFGVASDNIIPTLTRLGDVSAALNIPIGELSDLYGKARVQGTLYAEDLNQLAGRGIPIFTELAKVMGVNASEVKKLGSEGKISFALMEKAFVNMTAKGSQFGGLMAEQAKTLGGQWSNLQDNLGQIAVIIGDEISPTAKVWLELFNNIGSAIVSQKKESSAIAGILWKVALPAKALWDYATWTADAINDQVEKWNAAEKAVQKYQDTIESGRLPIKKAVEDTKVGGGRVKSGESDASKLARDTFEKNAQYGKLESEMIQQELDQRKALYVKYGLNKQKDIDALTQYEINAKKKIADAEDKEFAERLNKYNAYSQAIGGSITNLLSSFQSLFAARAKADIDALDAQMEAELQAAGVAEETQVEQAQREYNAAVATGDALAVEEKRRALVKAQIEEKYRKKKAQMEYEAALTAWELQVGMSLIQTFQAPLNAYVSALAIPGAAATPLPMILAGVAAIAAGAMFAATLASKPQPPKFASGGIIPGSAQGTQIIAGDGGTELVSNADQMANILSAIGNGQGGGSSMRQVPAMSKEALFNMIFQASQDGDLFINERALVKR
jgi:tape measure domain-containing protein